jgi:3-hydroxyisobutyrate dehydrogenase/glyoxylate/succinic semialdehyde reductase
MREGALWVDCSTVDPETACRLHDAAAAASVRHVDAPVAGSTPPADKGELIVLTGGSSEDVDEARPFLEPFAKAIHHIGETGRGSAMKLVVNAIIGHTMAGFAEACRLGRALGISEETIHQLVIGSHVAPPYLTPKGPRIRAGDYSPQFPLRLMYKDLALACTSAYRARIPVDALAAATQRFAAAHNAGMGNLDFTAIYRYMNGERNE